MLNPYKTSQVYQILTTTSVHAQRPVLTQAAISIYF